MSRQAGHGHKADLKRNPVAAGCPLPKTRPARSTPEAESRSAAAQHVSPPASAGGRRRNMLRCGAARL
eukprot:15450940-Alexandrium_andersonii.AAC.1